MIHFFSMQLFRLRRARKSPFSLAKRRERALKLARAEESIRKWLSYYMPSASDAKAEEESSLADRPKLERSKRNISFNKKVEIFQFTKEVGSEKTSSTVLVSVDEDVCTLIQSIFAFQVHDVIKGQYEMELEMVSWLLILKKNMPADIVFPGEITVCTVPQQNAERRVHPSRAV